jgi:hypothetical protein
MPRPFLKSNTLSELKIIKRPRVCEAPAVHKGFHRIRH